MLGVACLARHPDLILAPVLSNPIVPLLLIVLLDGIATLALMRRGNVDLAPHTVSRAMCIYLAGVGVQKTKNKQTKKHNIAPPAPVVSVSICAGIAMLA